MQKHLRKERAFFKGKGGRKNGYQHLSTEKLLLGGKWYHDLYKQIIKPTGKWAKRRILPMVAKRIEQAVASKLTGTGKKGIKKGAPKKLNFKI